MPEGLDERLAAAEAEVPNLRPGCEKRVVWAGRPGTRTPLSVVYVHGFSASPEELRPVPDRIAEGLGANLFFTRLSGHGQDGAAMGRATLGDWRRDIAEAARIGEELGERTLWIGCSTGATLITEALGHDLGAAGTILVSPNYALSSRIASLMLDAPGAGLWGPWIAGRERGFDLVNEAHGRYWTSSYPVRALFPMAQAMRATRAVRFERIGVPALFVYGLNDRVVSPRAVARVAGRWGAPVERFEVAFESGDDPMGHVVAGDILSPGQTDRVVARALDWARRQGLGGET
ncbi:alpha/beta hydrolase [Histidinibacterium aquaticum]|uniref:Alpha/beta hydrolase n=1 Tax=Histidinibacterium aquaticum TaxID=2613962 RepID=A0A5J5GP65_9RHOB|nr:alpha/beta hydrolase [Histidinibacterium aquaticum]KAA9009845.1 alpha/beta hydrolase [Histidinibacterium aquaticum]